MLLLSEKLLLLSRHGTVLLENPKEPRCCSVNAPVCVPLALRNIVFQLLSLLDMGVPQLAEGFHTRQHLQVCQQRAQSQEDVFAGLLSSAYV